MAHSTLQQLRLQDLFVRRQGVEFQKMVVLATGLLTPENQESVIKALKKLGDLMFPRDEEAEEERESSLRETLRVEGMKSYKVERLFTGERKS